MAEAKNSISAAFQAFMEEAPAYSQAWMEMVQKVGQANALDDKTRVIAYVSVLAATNMLSGIPFHVGRLKAMGVSRAEVMGAILVGLPAVGHGVTQALAVALEAYDAG